MAASRTAAFVALYRALESIERGRAPLFYDPLATAFLPRGLRLAVLAAHVPPLHRLLSRYADRRAPGARTSAIARTRFIDDEVRARVAAGIEQLVILGAGFDVRAHRLPALGGVRVFEVDRADTQASKRALLAHAPRDDVRDDVVYVAVDFLKDDVDARLAAEGWDRARPTLFVWEGVTNYLSREAVEQVLAWMGRAAPGSAVVFTYIHAGVLDGSARFEGADVIMANVRALGEPWRFGLRPDDVAAFVSRFGLALRENLGADEYRARYLPRDEAKGYAFYRIAVADVPR